MPIVTMRSPMAPSPSPRASVPPRRDDVLRRSARARIIAVLSATFLLLAGPIGEASAAWLVTAAGTSAAAADVLAPPTGLITNQSCTATSSPRLATISYRDATSATGLGTVTVTRPAGTVAGDVLVATYVVQGDTVPATPATWTRIGSGSHSTTDSLTIAIYTHVAAAGDPSEWTWSSTAVDRSAAITVAGYTGVDPIDAVDQAAGTLGTTSDVVAPSITPSTPGTHLVGLFSIRSDAALSAPASMSARAATTSVDAGPASAAVTLLHTDEPWGTTTATGTRTATAGAAGDNIGVLLSLNAATIDGTITYVGAASGTGGSSVSVTSAAGVASGDLLLVGYAKNGTAATIDTPTGWTRVRASDAVANEYQQTLFWRVATADDPAGTVYSFTSSDTASSAAVLAIYRGVNQQFPLVADSGLAASATTAITAPSVAPGRAHARLVGVFGIQGVNSLPAAPASMPFRASVGTPGGAPASRVAVGVGDEPWPTDTDTGARTATSADVGDVIGQLVALRPQSFPRLELSWAPTTAAYAEGYDFVLEREGAAVASSTISPASTASHVTEPLVAGTTYRATVQSRASSWRSAVADVTVTTVTTC